MIQCITQELLNLLTAEAEYTWSSHSLQKQRVYNTPAAHTREPAHVSSLLTHIHDRTEENGTQGMDRRDHDHDVQSAQCKKKHLSFSVCLSPCFDNILQKCPFSSPKTSPFSACHISMLTVWSGFTAVLYKNSPLKKLEEMCKVHPLLITPEVCMLPYH